MAKLKDVYTLVVVSMLSALSFVGMYIEISYWLFPFLKFNFAELFCVLGSLILGPWIGLLIAGIKNVLHYFFVNAEPVGNIANFVATSCMVLVIGFGWRIIRKKCESSKTVIYLSVLMIIAIIIRTGIMLPYNWLAFRFTFWGENFMNANYTLNEAGKIYILFHNPLFNVIQGLISSVAALPLFMLWRKSIAPSLNNGNNI